MSLKDAAWVLMRSGGLLNLLDPSPHAWTNGDLALRLARTYRWSCATRWERPLSVAQHSLLVLRIREMQADAPLPAAQRLRELLHDADEGLFHFDAPAPVKAQLGDGYQRITARLREAVRVRYDVPCWERLSYEAHKRADRIAAVSEAKHVVGWSEKAIWLFLGFREAPLQLDPLLHQPGLQPWEPWPEDLAARLFLERLEALRREMTDGPPTARSEAVLPDDKPERASERPWLPPTHVLVEGGCETIEGQVVRGMRDADGAWDLDGVFTVQTEDGDLVRVNGWNCITEIQ